MSVRKIPLVTNEVYHIYNRSVAQQPIFRTQKEKRRFLELIDYYRFANQKLRYSHYSRLKLEEKKKYLDSLHQSDNRQVKICSFSLMPNHYHLLLKQGSNNGISNFVRIFQDSYAKYINIRSKRGGSLFQSPFKAVRMESDEQFLHVSRYIHLNPLTSYILKNPVELKAYPWCSFVDYIGNKPRSFIDRTLLGGLIKDKEELIKFTFNQLDYQRSLNKVKHLVFE